MLRLWRRNTETICPNYLNNYTTLCIIKQKSMAKSRGNTLKTAKSPCIYSFCDYFTTFERLSVTTLRLWTVIGLHNTDENRGQSPKKRTLRGKSIKIYRAETFLRAKNGLHNTERLLLTTLACDFCLRLSFDFFCENPCDYASTFAGICGMILIA